MRCFFPFLFLLSCAAPADGVNVVVQVSGVPDDPGLLHAMVLLGDKPAVEAPSFDLSPRAGRREVSILLHLPTGAAGPLQVALGQKDLDGCLVATGLGEGFVDGAPLSLPVSLLPVPRRAPPCRAAEVPVIAAVTPGQLRTQNQDRISVVGFGFQRGATLELGGQPAQGVSYVSPLELLARAPKAATGPADVIVRNPDGGIATAPRLVRYALSTLKFRSVALQTPGRNYGCAVADVDQDGLPDLVWTDHRAAKLYVRLNRGGKFPGDSIEGFAGTRQFAALAVGDLNGDRVPDALVGSEYGDITGSENQLHVLIGKGDGTFQRASLLNVTERGHPDSLAIADLNGDGLQDIVVATTFGTMNGGYIHVLLGRADRTFPQADLRRFDVLADTRPGSLAVGDLNGDGRPDLALTSGSIQTNVKGLRLYFNQGFGQVADPFLPGGLLIRPDPDAPRQTPVSVALADVDGKQGPDLLLSFISPSLGTVMRNQGGGIFARDLGDAYPREGGLPILGSGDLDGDGLPDLLIPSLTGSGLHVVQNRGDGTFPSTLQAPFPTIEQALTPRAADLDGDGRTDLVVFSANGGVITLLMSEAE